LHPAGLIEFLRLDELQPDIREEGVDVVIGTPGQGIALDDLQFVS
jgi:hypothetical protein